MSDTVIVALISTSGTFLTAVVALLLNFRLFNSLERRIDGVDRRIEMIERDLKDFYKTMADHDKRLTIIEGSK